MSTCTRINVPQNEFLQCFTGKACINTCPYIFMTFTQCSLARLLEEGELVAIVSCDTVDRLWVARVVDDSRKEDETINVTWFRKVRETKSIVFLSPIDLTHSEPVPRASCLGSIDAYCKQARNSGASLTISHWEQLAALASRSASFVDLNSCDLPLPMTASIPEPHDNISASSFHKDLSVEEKFSNFERHCNDIGPVLKQVQLTQIPIFVAIDHFFLVFSFERPTT